MDIRKVPDAERRVLAVLAELGEAHGPAIARASQGAISTDSVYKLLSRLEDRGMVQKREAQVQSGDITVKRVLYQVLNSTNESMDLTPVIDFLQPGRMPNAWLKAAGLNVYVRRAIHSVNGKVLHTFDVANVENPNEATRGKGKFRAFLHGLKRLLEQEPELRRDITGIYVESVQNPRLAVTLQTLGYTQLETYPPSFYQALDKGATHEHR